MKDLWRKAQWVLSLMLMAVPLSFLPGAFGFTNRLWLLAAFALAYMLCACGCILMRGRFRLAAGLLAAAGMVAAGFVLLPWRTDWWVLTVPVGYAALLLATLPLSSWQYQQELSHQTCLVGVGVYVFVQLAMMFKPEWFAPFRLAFVLCFLAYGVLMVLAMNRRSLLDAAPRGHRAPVGMRRKNHVFTAGLMLLVLLISAIPAIGRALAWAVGQITELVAAFFRLLNALLPQSSVGGGGGGGEPGMLAAGPAEEPSLFARILEALVIVVAVLAGVMLLFLLLRSIWRRLRVLFSRLWTMLNRYALAASEDYVDEVSDTRASNDGTSSRRWFAGWKNRVNEDKLSPTERIRYRYSRMLQRRQDWQPGSTARENLAEEAAGIYERARYSTRTVSAEEAERFAQYSKTVEKNASHS